MGTIVVALILLGIVLLIAIALIRDKKRGKCACGGNCGSCPGCAGWLSQDTHKNADGGIHN